MLFVGKFYMVFFVTFMWYLLVTLIWYFFVTYLLYLFVTFMWYLFVIFMRYLFVTLIWGYLFVICKNCHLHCAVQTQSWWKASENQFDKFQQNCSSHVIFLPRLPSYWCQCCPCVAIMQFSNKLILILIPVFPMCCHHVIFLVFLKNFSFWLQRQFSKV